ncbi:MAG: YqgE/AlgH family protein [Terriglobales bacterium]
MRLGRSCGIWIAALAALSGGLAAQAKKAPQTAAHAAVGELLAATDKVGNAQFRHAVVLLVDATAQGAAGLVLNRPGQERLSQVFPKEASASGRTDTAFWGGPVDGKRIFCLVQVDGSLREGKQILPGLYVSDSPALMELALNAQKPAASFRVYLGYTGWVRGQLQREIRAGLWRVLPGSAQAIFDADPATLWTRLQQAKAKR